MQCYIVTAFQAQTCQRLGRSAIGVSTKFPTLHAAMRRFRQARRTLKNRGYDRVVVHHCTYDNGKRTGLRPIGGARV